MLPLLPILATLIASSTNANVEAEIRTDLVKALLAERPDDACAEPSSAACVEEIHARLLNTIGLSFNEEAGSIALLRDPKRRPSHAAISSALMQMAREMPAVAACTRAMEELPRRHRLRLACTFHVGSELWRVHEPDGAIASWRWVRSNDQGAAGRKAQRVLRAVAVNTHRADLLLDCARSEPPTVPSSECSGLNKDLLADCFLLFRWAWEHDARDYPLVEVREFCSAAIRTQVERTDCSLAYRIRQRATDDLRRLNEIGSRGEEHFTHEQRRYDWTERSWPDRKAATKEE